ncbi:MAG: MraY family glycosyltransferase [Candidatus Nanopelagicales bacterium]
MWLIGLTALLVVGLVPAPTFIGLAGSAILVALVGWIDDVFSLSATYRIAVHSLASLWALAWLGGLPRINVGSSHLSLGVSGSILAVIAVVWSINSYNFMDGIDGLAASEAIAVSSVLVLLSILSADWTLAAVLIVLCSAVAGFLVWNRHPARIFMGDVGSGFLGLVFASLAVVSENKGSIPLLVWVMLLAVFAVDSTATLITRLLRGEPLHIAHKSHAYQLAVQRGHSQGKVVSSVAAIDLLLGFTAFVAVQVRDLLLPLFLASMLAIFLGRALLLKRWSYRTGSEDVSPYYTRGARPGQKQ